FIPCRMLLPEKRMSSTRKTTMKNRPSITEEEDHKNKEVPDICLERTTVHYQDELLRCIEQECGSVIPHVHGKLVLLRRSKVLAFFLLLILLATGVIVWHCFTNQADRDIYEYQHVPEKNPIWLQIAI
ncbi:hypothetical protein, partial [Akkermansia sp. BIOML-A56]